MANREIITDSNTLLDLIVDTSDNWTVDALVKIHGKITIDDLAFFVEEKGLTPDYLKLLTEDFERTEHLIK